MNDDNQLSRARKYKKRRSVTRSITIFSLLAILLALALILTFIIGKKDQQVKNDIKEPAETELVDDDSINEQQEGSKDLDNDSEATDSPDATDGNNNDDIESETVNGDENSTSSDQRTDLDNHSVIGETVSSDDPNVIAAYEGDWQPIGTSQSEPHELVFDKDSTDWKEMVSAIESVVTIDNMIIHWLGNNGPQKAVGTVSAPNHADIHRVYLSWVPQQGWRPTRIEQLERVEVIKHQSTEESD